MHAAAEWARDGAHAGRHVRVIDPHKDHQRIYSASAGPSIQIQIQMIHQRRQIRPCSAPASTNVPISNYFRASNFMKRRK